MLVADPDPEATRTFNENVERLLAAVPPVHEVGFAETRAARAAGQGTFGAIVRLPEGMPSADSPSMVVMGVLAAEETGVWHARTARPRTCTVHAPHWPIPHPYLVPFRFRTSRSTQSSGISAGTSTTVDLPFTFRV
jgi:hypothetical protein